jgi:hypothetical protein
MKEKIMWAPPVIRIRGRYANFFKVGHNACEFVFEFGQSQGESGDTSIHTRIVTAPGYAKAFVETLCKSIAKHEETFGNIDRG